MSVNFYDVNFNQSTDSSGITAIPAISGYIIDDYGYEHMTELEGSIAEEHFISTAQATNSLTGAISMDRRRIQTASGEIVVCRLQPDGHHCIYVQYTDAGPINVIICDDTGTTIEQLTLPYLEGQSNISLVGHFNANDELDWVSVGYTYRNQLTNEIYVFINTNGFSSTIKDELKPYVYLKYKYEYQVVIQKSLRGSNDFQLSRFPAEWFTKKQYGTGEGQSRRYNEVVLRTDPDHLDVFDVSAAFKVVLSQNDYWKNNNSNYALSLRMGAYLEDIGYSLGSDIFRLLSDGKYYNGVDLNVSNIVVKSWNANQVMHEISFTGGKLQIYARSGVFSYSIRLLDNDNNILDSYDIPMANNGIYVGDPNLYYYSICSCYLAEYNNKYYLIGLRQFTQLYNDNDELIRYPYSGGNYYNTAASYQILYAFSNEGNNLLYHATDSERIVPADPDSLTPEESSNQTSDPDNKNELGNEIPHPKYNTGEWEDGTSEGIRGSGQGQQTGGNAEGKLDQQPGLPSQPQIPTGISTGFVKMLNPTDSEIQSFCTEITSDSVLNTLKQFFTNNPLDFITSLHVVPGTYALGGSKVKLKYGGYESQVPMTPITGEYTELDFGKLDLKEIYGSWEDYNPHTKMTIYLPYIGIKDLDVDRIQGSELHLKYLISASTGSILAFLTSVRKDNRNNGAEILVGQWAGQAKYTIPLTSVQHDAAVNAAMSIVAAAVSVGAAVATAGGSIAATAASAAAIGTSVGNAALSGAHAGKVDVTMQGSVAGDMAFFTSPDAYIQIEFPIEGRPDDYDHIVGKPSNITTDLAHQPMNNYIEFANIDVDGIDAPTDEKQLIVEMLKGGIYT